MYSRLRLAQKYIHYYLTAANGKGHGIHSPFVYDLIRNVLNDRHEYPAYARIEGLRRRLLQAGTVLDVKDLGAGSSSAGSASTPDHSGSTASFSRRSIAEIARHAAKPSKLGQLLFRVARHYHPSRILELGTSLGLSTAYLTFGAQEMRPSDHAPASPPQILTIEGASAIAAAARLNFQSLGLEDICLLTGDFEDQLPAALDRIGQIDLAFVDGNHRYTPTLQYFNALIARASPSSVLIFDDIHWSRDMEMAWEAIKADPRSMLTIDLFFLGFVFLREDFCTKQDFKIRF